MLGSAQSQWPLKLAPCHKSLSQWTRTCASGYRSLTAEKRCVFKSIDIPVPMVTWSTIMDGTSIHQWFTLILNMMALILSIYAASLLEAVCTPPDGQVIQSPEPYTRSRFTSLVSDGSTYVFARTCRTSFEQLINLRYAHQNLDGHRVSVTAWSAFNIFRQTQDLCPKPAYHWGFDPDSWPAIDNVSDDSWADNLE